MRVSICDALLNNFIGVQIYNLSSPVYSGFLSYAIDHTGESYFPRFMMVLWDGWTVIVKNRSSFKMSGFLFSEMQRLFDLIHTFNTMHGTPTTPSKCASVLATPEWKKIQEQARCVRRRAETEMTVDYKIGTVQYDD